MHRFTSHRPRRPVGFVPRVEVLENRIVPDVKVVQNGTLVKITGDKENDTVQIRDNGTDAGAAIQVVFNAKKKKNSSFSSAGPVTEIQVKLKDGDDVVTYEMNNPAATGVSRKMVVELGGGKDRFTGVMTTTNFVGGAFWDVSVSGNAGKDQISLTTTGNIDAGAALNVALTGGANEDTLTTSYNGAVDGTLRLRSEGGADKDTISSTANLGAGSATLGSLVEVLGNGGKDTLTLVATKDPADPAVLEAVIDGGPLKDTASVGNSNVNVVQNNI